MNSIHQQPSYPFESTDPCTFLGPPFEANASPQRRPSNSAFLQGQIPQLNARISCNSPQHRCLDLLCQLPLNYPLLAHLF